MMQPDAHERWSQLLPLYVNGRLEGAEREQLARHLAECARCRAELAGWREIARLARQPHPGEDRLQPAQASLDLLHHRIASQADAPTKEVRMQPNNPPTTPPSSHPERRAIFPAVAIVALLAVFVVTGFAVFRAHGNGHPTTPNVGTSAKTPTTAATNSKFCQTSAAIMGNGGTFHASTGQSVTVHGVTMILDHFYADFSRTIVLFHVQTPTSQSAPYGPQDLSIITASGEAIPVTMMPGGLEPTKGGMRNWQSFGQFPSLPLADFGSQQTVTLSVQQMVAEQDSGGPLLNGPWQLRVTFTAPQPHSVQTLACTPQTHNGLSIQPLSVAQSPAASQFDGYPGGIKLTVCLAGKGASYGHFDENYAPAGQGSIGSGGPTPGFTEGILTLPNGKQVLQQLVDDNTATCSIGGQPGGAYTLLYLTLTSPVQGKATFTIPTVYTSPVVSGPWTFTIDLK